MERMSLLGYAVCGIGLESDALPFDVGGIDRDAMPAGLRRRASEATQLAFSAAARACREAARSPAALPSVFASVGGEMQVTDQLCIELAKPEGLVSPTAFHNSVHNTAAGYWTIVHGCPEPATALAAGHDTFALGLLEAWCQLSCNGGELLVVCYDERWPGYLAPPLGRVAVASAMVLAAGDVPEALAHLGKPCPIGASGNRAEFSNLLETAPAAWALPLLQSAALGEAGPVALSGNGWVGDLLLATSAAA